MVLKAVCLLAARLGAQVSAAVATSPCRCFGTSIREIKRPAEASSIFRLLGFPYQQFRDVGSSAFLVGLPFSVSLGFWFGLWRPGALAFWLDGGFWCWFLHGCILGKRQEMKTDCTVGQNCRQFFFNCGFPIDVFLETGELLRHDHKGRSVGSEDLVQADW